MHECPNCNMLGTIAWMIKYHLPKCLPTVPKEFWKSLA